VTEHDKDSNASGQGSGAKARDAATFDVAEVLSYVARQGRQKSFGWASLDKLELGFNPGELAVVAGRTGHGKSTVLLNVLLNWLQNNPNELFLLFSHEIPPEAVAIKLLSILSRKFGAEGWSYHEIRRWAQQGAVPEAQREEDLVKAFEELRSFQERLVIVYEPDWNATKIAAFAKDLSQKHGGLGGIMVDYLQLVLPPEGQYESQEQEVTAVAKELKRLGVEIAAPVVAAAQIGREAAFITDWIPDGRLEDEKVLRAIAKRRPQLHHLRQGGGEQEADIVIGLLNYRADYVAALEENADDSSFLREVGTSGPVDVSVIKNRYGQLGVASLVLESRVGYIRDPGVFGH
jgi:replicative DNA helicase